MGRGGESHTSPWRISATGLRLSDAQAVRLGANECFAISERCVVPRGRRYPGRNQHIGADLGVVGHAGVHADERQATIEQAGDLGIDDATTAMANLGTCAHHDVFVDDGALDAAACAECHIGQNNTVDDATPCRYHHAWSNQ